jgi:lipopolysaccharide assembly protein A
LRYTFSMRVVQFFQVVVLLFLLGYAVLVYLENPVLLRLPLLFAGRELVVPAGLGLGLGVLVGGLYVALLILPRYLRQRVLRRADTLRRRNAETRLQATLQAVIDGASSLPEPPTEPPMSENETVKVIQEPVQNEHNQHKMSQDRMVLEDLPAVPGAVQA